MKGQNESTHGAGARPGGRAEKRDPNPGERLLNHLDPDPRLAELAYQRLFYLLTRIFAASKCPDPENLAGEVVLRGIRKLARNKFTRGNLTSYLARIAAFVVREDRRRRAREVELPGDDEVPVARDWRVHPSDLVLELREALETLSAEDRDTLLDYLWHGLPHDEENRSTARVKIYRIRRKLPGFVPRPRKATNPGSG